MTRYRFRIFHILIYLFVFAMLLVFLAPLSFVGVTALKQPAVFLKNPLTFVFSPTLDNFINAWRKASLGSYVFNSLLYTSSATVVSLLCALLIAFPIARRYIGFSKGLMLFLMIGLFLPDGTIPLFHILLRLGLYNTRLGYMLSLITVGGVPLMFFVSYLKGIPRELDEAAIMDGCGYFRFFFRIIIPLAKPAISSMTILTAINVWNEITRAVIFMSSPKLFPIAAGLYAFSGQYSTLWTELMAALVVVAAPLIIIYIFLQRYIIDGLTAGAVKA